MDKSANTLNTQNTINTEHLLTNPDTNDNDNSNSIQIIRKIEKNNQTNYNYLFKIALIGDSGIGKSSILIRFADNDFRDDTSSTIGVDFKIVSVSLGKDIMAKMQIWDTCGSERFKSLTSSFIKSCPTFLLIFDITKYKTFKNLINWINIIKENTNPKMLCLIGNKCDLENHRQVKREDALEFAKKYNLKYIETSAKFNENIEDVFIHVSQTLYEDLSKNKMQSEGGSSFEIGGCRNIQGGFGLNANGVNGINQSTEQKGFCCQ